MNKPHIVNLIYSVFLMVAGITGFLLSYIYTGIFHYTPLILPLFGLVLISLTGGIKRQDKILSHVAVMLTVILALFVLIMLIININNGFMLNRKTVIFLLVLILSIIVVTIYVVRFIRVRKGQIEVNSMMDKHLP